MNELFEVENLVEGSLGRVFTAAQLEIRLRGEALYSKAWGLLDPEASDEAATVESRFDLASVTKLFAVTAFMALVEEGRVGLDQTVSSIVPGFSGLRTIQPYEDPLRPGSLTRIVDDTEAKVDSARVTFRDILRHTSGLPAWRPLYREGSPEAARRAAIESFFSYPRGLRVVYSDVGLILLGLSIETITGLRIDEAIRSRVSNVLNLHSTEYFRAGYPSIGRRDSVLPSGIAATEFCAWRRRRLIGEVHDENAAAFAGVSGHAGLFSKAADLARFGQAFLDPAVGLLRADTIDEMRRLQSSDGVLRRGLGFALWSSDPESAANPLGSLSFGHNGFTGTSLWMDPERELVVACLTNRVYYGRDPRGINAFRPALHRAVRKAVDRLCGSGSAS